MLFADFLRLSLGALSSHRLRSSLTALGIAVGIAAVVLLTSIGEGIHQFTLNEFTQFGTHLITVTPGLTTTHGVPGAMLGTVRPLSMEDAKKLQEIPSILGVNPNVQGNAEVESGGKVRRTTILGCGPDLNKIFRFKIVAGQPLPPDDPGNARPFALLGATLRRELFGDQNPLGQRIRIAQDRYRVIGALEAKGDFLGFDLDDAVFIPAGRALDIFNRESLMEINMLYNPVTPIDEVVESVRRTMIARHGREDFTIITQQKMLEVLGSILNILTFAIGALGGISLLVGGVGILTIMTIAVTDRTGEIGLLRALGAERMKILWLFLGEAATLAAIGGLAGLALGIGACYLISTALPNLPMQLSWTYSALAEALAVAVGLAAGVLPARHAARLDVVDALRAE
ncbi:MAG: ABC transporter permease [Planctomycetes bacterium]|nr:ABC transporter permease [Planctomycetota bacterium]